MPHSPLAIHYHYFLIVLTILFVHCLEYIPKHLEELLRPLTRIFTTPFLRITGRVRGQLIHDALKIQPGTDLTRPVIVHAPQRR